VARRRGETRRRLADLCVAGGGDSLEFAAARISSARESLKKLSGNALAPLVVEAFAARRRVTFRSGLTNVDTLAIGDRIIAVAQRHRGTA
jgi:hypothetical protein